MTKISFLTSVVIGSFGLIGLANLGQKIKQEARRSNNENC